MRLLALTAALALPLLQTVGSSAAAKSSAAPRVDFIRDIQPILAARCYACHGLKREESSLRLDKRETLFRGGAHGPPIVPGKSAESLLVAVISGTHRQIPAMPKEGERLEPKQIQSIRDWIDQGANWPQSVAGTTSSSSHWAFKPPVRSKLPTVKAKSWVRNPIDQFILARLEKDGLPPSHEADRITLLRRLSLDLIGLPPTIAEVDAFLADHSPNAYQRQVERLLDSPHYGERWGRHWLDAARYADSDGFEKDKSRGVWFYRDWVVNAFNRDLPYDQFIIQQIAGDLLPNSTQDQSVATGFLRNSMLNEEGGVDPEQFRMDGMFDRMDAIGKGILGLTIQCAQCHNHKYDPLTQRDYYRLFAFINNDHDAQRVVYTPDEQMKIADLTRQMREVEADLQHRAPEWPQRMAKWEDEEVSRLQPTWTVVSLEHLGDNGQRYLPQKDGSLLAQGYAPTKFTAPFRTTTKLTGITAFRLELLTDLDLPSGGPGRSFKGTCALTEFSVDIAPANDPTKKTRVPMASAIADYDQPEHELEKNFYDRSSNKRVTGPVKYAIDGNANTAWGIDAGPGRRNQDRKAVFVPATKVGFDDGTLITFNLQQNHGGWNSDENMNNNLGRFRISVSTSDGTIVADPLPKRVRDILATPREQRTPSQQAVFGFWRTMVPEWREANARIEALWKQWPQGATQLVLRARDEPRKTRLLKRGDWLKPDATVSAGVPAFLHQLQPNPPPPFPNKEGGDSQRLDRLTFARWLVDRRSPTTARAFVNRVWQAYFGNGLVTTPEDFGLQAEKPSHPELLDWLAVEFMEGKHEANPSRERQRAAAISASPRSNSQQSQLTRNTSQQPLSDVRGSDWRPASNEWSIKSLHRLIVTSATYRQSSRITPQLLERDPRNRLLARGPRFRVEAEIVRDIAVAASGLLNPKLGGPAIFSPIPYKLLPPISYGPFDWIEETGPDRYRRALYTFRRRSTPYPALQSFDAPNGDFSCVRRTRSNTPLQALTTLNETLFVEAAQALALRTLREGGATDRDRVVYSFRLCTSRIPTNDEVNTLLGLLQRTMERSREVPIAAPEKPAPLPPGVTPAQHTAWTVVARVVLNLDETITKE